MNLVFLRYPNWYRGLLEGQVGNMPVRVRVSPGGLLNYLATQIKPKNTYRSGPKDGTGRHEFTSVSAYFCSFS